MARDPALGTKMPVPSGRSLNPRARIGRAPTRAVTVLLFTGPCSACTSARLLDDWQVASKRCPGVRVIVVSQESPAHIRDFAVREGYDMPFYADTAGVLAARYNAAWTPRAFGVDSRNRLIWCEGAAPGASPMAEVRHLAEMAGRPDR
jgi:hypothetical protein